MGMRVRNILFIVLLVCGLCSCGKKARVIPRRTMTKIYADMAMTDATIQNKTYNERMVADTSLVYEAVFRKYGYTTADFIASQNEYIKDAGRYVRMLKKAVLQTEDDKKVLVAEQKRLQDLRERAANVRRHAPNRIYLMDTLDLADTVWFDFDFQLGLDTAFAGPQMIVWADTVGMADHEEVQSAVPDILVPKQENKQETGRESHHAIKIMEKNVEVQ